MTGISLSGVLDGNQPQVMETGDSDFLTLEGIDLGHSIKSLTIEALTNNKNSGWLPSVIIISSSLLPAQLVFKYEADDWLGFNQAPKIVKEVEAI